MALHLDTHATARRFLDRAGPWLLRSEAEHSLVLGIAGRLADAAGPPAAPVFLATVEDGGAVAGVAMRTPPHKLLLSRMPLGAVPLVVEAAAEFGDLPAVLGPAPVAEAFAEAWAAGHAVEPRPGMRQRVFRLTRLTPPAHPPAGYARPADADDTDTVAEWMDRFQREAGATESVAREWAERHVHAGDVLLWDHDGPVSMAAAVARSPTGARVGAVYTPPPLRGRGYASAVVAALSGRLLRSGRRFCSLYTDLANPTSNGIYRRLGYAPVADVADVVFHKAGG